MERREFLRLLALAAAAGATLRPGASAAQAAAELYDVPPFGNVSLLHFTDVHAQLLPTYFREPSVNLGVGAAAGRPPHLVGEALLKHFGIAPDTARAHAFTYLDFERAARRYGKVGGFAHLATLVKRLRASRPHALLLDGGDTWQGSAVSLWTRGADMIGAQKLLGVDLMTAHWEFTYGAERVRQAVDKELAPHRVHRAERQDRGLRGSGVQAVRAAQRQRRGGRGHRPGLPLHADRQSAPHGARLELRHPGAARAAARRRGARQGRAARRAAVAQRHGRGPQARRRGCAASTSSSAAIRTTACPAPVDRRQDLGHQCRLERQVPRACSTWTSRAENVAAYRYRLLPVFSNLLPAGCGDGQLHRPYARTSRSEARRKSSPSPKVCSTAGAASTAPGTSSSSRR